MRARWLATTVVWSKSDTSDEPMMEATLLIGKPSPQLPPTQGTEPHVILRRYCSRLVRSDYTLLGHVGADGFPVLRPVDLWVAGDHLDITGASLHAGSRRAGVLAHWFEPRLKGRGQSVFTGRLEVENGWSHYAPHTFTGYTMPRVSDLSFTLASSVGTKVRYWRSVREGHVEDGRYRSVP